MEILVVNDDGVFAEGIQILAKALLPYGNVTVVGPDQGRSACSHSILIRQTIEFLSVDAVEGIPCYSCSGMPVDCVRLATSVLKKKFDIVFSGINNGLNCGTDIVYSGTVAGAKEAIIEGIPGVAISTDHGYFDIAIQEIDSLVKYVMENHLYSTDYVLNINFPTKEFHKSKGYRFTKQGIKSFKTEFMKNNKGSYDEFGEVITYDMDEDTDVYLGKKGYITFVPVGVDQTYHKYVNELKSFEKDE